MFIRALVLYALVVSVLAAASESSNAEDGCTIEGTVVPVGEKFASKSGCYQYECVSKGLVTGLGCPAAMAGPEYKKVEDLSKPYPDCCPKFVKTDAD